ncbi:tetraprenyl-beta-curcumene synthase family protein [Niallia sp. Krafla_26]|uniref:tetraprenyl-beta-curcumene synthase family protein n=1 Tax=Niallia sp. Krafla_26 TaxID=3064703 RepID=UPI003D180732
MTVPTSSITLMAKAYRYIFPTVHKELAYWQKRAEDIPDAELRNQALASIKHKTFHCEGGAIMALLANKEYKEAIRFIVAYQTISDYLDNLCDRSTSLDPADFAALHEAMSDALTIDAGNSDYYRNRNEREDGNYLNDLVATCQDVLKRSQAYRSIKNSLLELCHYYCDLQIHKHVDPKERVPRLMDWFDENSHSVPDMEWYEFSACSGSTLGIFCMVSYSMNHQYKEEDVQHIQNGYFPYIQGLHILLDYFIDQEEDKRFGDLNFCSYFKDHDQLFTRLKHFMKQSDLYTKNLPFKRFHQLINRGLLGLYLSDEKVREQKDIRKLAKGLMKAGGPICYFFYINAYFYRKLKSMNIGSQSSKAKKRSARYVG